MSYFSIPQEIFLHVLSPFVGLDAFYQLSLADQSLHQVFIQRSLQLLQEESLEPFRVSQNNQNLEMMNFLVMKSSLLPEELAKISILENLPLLARLLVLKYRPEILTDVVILEQYPIDDFLKYPQEGYFEYNVIYKYLSPLIVGDHVLLDIFIQRYLNADKLQHIPDINAMKNPIKDIFQVYASSREFFDILENYLAEIDLCLLSIILKVWTGEKYRLGIETAVSDKSFIRSLLQHPIGEKGHRLLQFQNLIPRKYQAHTSELYYIMNTPEDRERLAKLLEYLPEM